MRIVGFHIREPKRDEEKDGRRRVRLCAAIQSVELEVRSEMTGLQTRYEAASVNAAFLLEAIENGQTSFDARVGELSSTMITCEARIKELSRQVDFLAALCVAASRFGGPPKSAGHSHCHLLEEGSGARPGLSKA